MSSSPPRQRPATGERAAGGMTRGRTARLPPATRSARQKPSLGLDDLVTALEMFGTRYHAVDVFANDLREVSAILRHRLPAGVIRAGKFWRRFFIKRNGKNYVLDLIWGTGVARLARKETAPEQGSLPSRGATTVAGGFAGAAIAAAASKKGSAWPAGLLLGLLVGNALEKHSTTASQQVVPRYVFTLRFDPDSQEWHAYDGGLTDWMKSALAAT